MNLKRRIASILILITPLTLHGKCYDTKKYPHSILHIDSPSDAENIRRTLIQYIWKSDKLPESSANVTLTEEVEIPPDIFPKIKLENLRRIDKLHVNTPHSDGYAYNMFFSVGYLFRPENARNRLVMVYQSHSHNLIENGVQQTITALIKEGYSVLAMQMPLMGSNKVKDFPHHSWFAKHESEKFCGLKYFLGPINTIMNFLDMNYEFKDISMIGVSGGGWATHVYSAVDPRISKSFPVAGSLPRYLRTPECNANIGNSGGDWEEGGAEMTVKGVTGNSVRDFMRDNVSFLDMYILAAFGKGRKQIHILNEYDSCCFSGTEYTSFESAVKKRVGKLGEGAYDVVLDSSFQNDHKISDWAINEVILPGLSRD